MELTQLNHFRVVAETENIVDASNILSISQPALTKSIQNLENELNTSLFDRTNHKLVLNKQGKALLKYSNDLFADLSDMLIDLKFSNLTDNEVRICSSVNAILAYTIPHINNAFPDIFFYHQLRLEHKLNTYIEEKIFDIAISATKPTNKELQSQLLLKDWVLISVPNTHPLYDHDLIHLSDLENETFVVSKYFPQVPLPYHFEQLLTENSIPINHLYTSDQMSHTKVLREGNLLSYCSSLGARALNYGPHRRYIPVDPKEKAFLNYYITYLKENQEYLSPYVKWFKKHFNKYSII